MIHLVKNITINQWIFALGIYPSFNAQEKYELFIEMVENYLRYSNQQETTIEETSLRKLSSKKKASFASFLKEFNLPKEIMKYESEDVRWITLLSLDYPEQLRQISIPPVVLFYKGDLSLIRSHDVLGITGTRKPSDYGLDVTKRLVSSLVKETGHSIGVISGLGEGIDTVAHQTTLEMNGLTIAVLGNGFDYFYPENNRILQKEIEESGLVLSEYPFGIKPLSYHFPERNRIIAGLSRGVLIIEAPKRSGSLITAYSAIDENRDLFVAPGSILNTNFEGSHRLIQLGGVLTQTSTDILKEWDYI